MSVWQRAPAQLSYTMLGIHKLLPPPSRISNNVALALLCISACPWQQGVEDLPGRPIVLPLVGPKVFTPQISRNVSQIPLAGNESAGRAENGSAVTDNGHGEGWQAEFHSNRPSLEKPQSSVDKARQHDLGSQLATSAANAAAQGKDPHTLLLITVTDQGNIWQWHMPLAELSQKTLAHAPSSIPQKGDAPQLLAAPHPPKGPTEGLPSPPIPPRSPPPGSPGPQERPCTKPSLLGILHTLPHPVTTFSICPTPVAVGVAGVPSGVPSMMSGPGGDAVSVMAAVTTAGNVELVTVCRGSLMPLLGTVSVSLGGPARSSLLVLSRLWLHHESSMRQRSSAGLHAYNCFYIS